MLMGVPSFIVKYLLRAHYTIPPADCNQLILIARARGEKGLALEYIAYQYGVLPESSHDLFGVMPRKTAWPVRRGVHVAEIRHGKCNPRCGTTPAVRRGW